MRGLAQQVVQQTFKTEVQKFDEELGNDYKANQHVYRVMVAQMNRRNVRMRKVIESIFVVNSLYCFTTVHEWGSVEMYTCSNTAVGRKRKNRWFCFFYI